MLASMSFVVLIGFQPMERDLSARQREFVPRYLSCSARTMSVLVSKDGRLQPTYHRRPLIVVLGERCRFRFANAFGHEGFGDNLSHIVIHVFTVFSEVIPFASMTSGRVRHDGIVENNIQVSN